MFNQPRFFREAEGWGGGLPVLLNNRLLARLVKGKTGTIEGRYRQVGQNRFDLDALDGDKLGTVTCTQSIIDAQALKSNQSFSLEERGDENQFYKIVFYPIVDSSVVGKFFLYEKRQG